MGAKSGAGASVSSGASFQARVGAYVITTAICDAEIELTAGVAVRAASFETTESIDDINIALVNGSTVFLQAKATIDYSIGIGGNLRSVINQFSQQACSGRLDDKYILITSSKSSRKVIFDMRAALDAYRGQDDERFRRDQPKVLIDIIDDLLNVLEAENLSKNTDISPEDVLHRIYVHVLDIEQGECMEQALILILQSKKFAAPSAMWGKIISDCVSHSKTRQTVQIAAAREAYERYRVTDTELPESESADLVRIELHQLDVSVGRELILGRVNADDLTDFIKDGVSENTQLVLMEFRRFDSNCSERIQFHNGMCVLKNGVKIDVIRRTSTYTGMTRMLERDADVLAGNSVIHFPFESEEDLETGLCAQLHLTRVRKAALDNPRPLYCIHCYKPVSSSAASMVEVTAIDSLIVGLSHQECLLPDDRVIGSIKSQFFDEHSDLIHFDPNAWLTSIQNGQQAFSGAKEHESKGVVMAWGGKMSSVQPPNYIIEIILEGGGQEIVTLRNSVHRFSKVDAENFAIMINKQIAQRRESDPFCYSSESKAFGPRSTLLPMFGGKESIIPAERARVRTYDVRLAARYTRPGSWYAPLFFLRSLPDGEPVTIESIVPLLRDPLTLRNYLDNWRNAGINLGEYETVSLLTDDQFDDFMVDMSKRDLGVVVDPLLSHNAPFKPVAGIEIRPIDDFVPGRQG